MKKGQRIGYSRVSTLDQNTERRLVLGGVCRFKRELIHERA